MLQTWIYIEVRSSCYENTPVQSTNFHWEKIDIFLIFAQKIVGTR